MADGDQDYRDLDDGRVVGEWVSRYTTGAWCQIVPEFALLTIYLIVPSYFLLESIIEPPDGTAREGYVYSTLLSVHVSAENAKWIALALAGFMVVRFST